MSLAASGFEIVDSTIEIDFLFGSEPEVFVGLDELKFLGGAE